jgi:hypothetical protein
MSSANGHRRCDECRHFKPIAWPDPNNIDRGLCRKNPPELVETAHPDYAAVLPIPLPPAPPVPLIVLPIFPATMIGPDGTVKKFGYGSMFRPVYANWECGEFQPIVTG